MASISDHYSCELVSIYIGLWRDVNTLNINFYYNEKVYFLPGLWRDVNTLNIYSYRNEKAY
jgi:hypothetical protein